jgi:hypothetical protein
MGEEKGEGGRKNNPLILTFSHKGRRNTENPINPLKLFLDKNHILCYNIQKLEISND